MFRMCNWTARAYSEAASMVLRIDDVIAATKPIDEGMLRDPKEGEEGELAVKVKGGILGQARTREAAGIVIQMIEAGASIAQQIIQRFARQQNIQKYDEGLMYH